MSRREHAHCGMRTSAVPTRRTHCGSGTSIEPATTPTSSQQFGQRMVRAQRAQYVARSLPAGYRQPGQQPRPRSTPASMQPGRAASEDLLMPQHMHGPDRSAWGLIRDNCVPSCQALSAGVGRRQLIVHRRLTIGAVLHGPPGGSASAVRRRCLRKVILWPAPSSPHPSGLTEALTRQAAALTMSPHRNIHRQVRMTRNRNPSRSRTVHRRTALVSITLRKDAPLATQSSTPA